MGSMTGGKQGKLRVYYDISRLESKLIHSVAEVVYFYFFF